MSVLIAAAALPCGLLIGLLLGSLGGGGSVLAVPALVYLLGQSPHEATAGALIVVMVGSVTGLLCHARAGRVRWAAGTAFGALGTAGSYLGSRWSAALDPAVLMAAFAGLLLVVAAMLVSRGLREWRAAGGARPLRESPETVSSRDTGEEKAVPLRDTPEPPAPLRHSPGPTPLRDGPGPAPLRDAPGPLPLRGTPSTAPTAPSAGRTAGPSHPTGPTGTGPTGTGPTGTRPADTPPTSPQPAGPHSAGPHSTGPRPAGAFRPARRPLRFAVTASAVGLLTGFFGVGGGFVVVPALTLVLGLEMPVAIGTSLLVILLNSLTALGTRAGTGALDWPVLAGFAACAAVGSHLGNRLTTRLRPHTLTTAFACLVTVLAVSMAVTALPRLWSP
ncbi:TSUP family transporter [Streptomyces sp. CA2R101]|uniref:sulfite exporter TauE/SafE family protein n=1 Tax=Streptomyces sp. CA2R101 TaxID=3120152 RepID=UPI003FA727E5